MPITGLQNRIIDDVSQGYFEFYESDARRLWAALAHSGHPLVDFLSLARTWPSVQPAIRDAILAIARTTVVVLVLAAEEKLLDLGTVFERLKQTNFRAAPTLLDEILRDFVKRKSQ